VAFVAFVAFGLTGCGAEGAPTTPQAVAVPSDAPLEPATPRGLAVRLLSHLTQQDVTSVAGTGTTESIDVMVSTADPTLEAVALYVVPPGKTAIRTCGVDFGYTELLCQTKPNLISMAKNPDAKHMEPVLNGRYYNKSRGAVLVQVWGRDTPENRNLIKDLLNDSMLGINTAVPLNDAGEDLADFEELQITSSVHMG
jgi:hypothetical protein